MQQPLNVPKGPKQNQVTVMLSSESTFLKIFDANGQLISHTEAKGAKGSTKIVQSMPPGDYTVETDGDIAELASTEVGNSAREIYEQ